MSHSYSKSMMRDTINYFIRWYKESDVYALLLSFIWMIPMTIIGIIASLFIDFLATIFEAED